MVAVIMTASAVVLALGYVWAAVVRFYIGFQMKWVRRTYWVSAVPCLMLASSLTWSLFVDEQFDAPRIILGRSGALIAIPLIFTRPGLLALRRHRAGDPRL